MPLKRDEQGGGANSDGSKNTAYCSHCYQQGKIVLPDIKVAAMQAKVRQKLIEFGFPEFLTGVFTRGIPKLQPWQSGRAKKRSRFLAATDLRARQMQLPARAACFLIAL